MNEEQAKQVRKARRQELMRVYKEEGFKAAFTKWRYNYATLIDTEMLLTQKVVGDVGSTVFLVVAAVVFIIKGTWYVGLALAFAALSTYVGFRSSLNQLTLYREAKKKTAEAVEEAMKAEMKNEIFKT